MNYDVEKLARLMAQLEGQLAAARGLAELCDTARQETLALRADVDRLSSGSRPNHAAAEQVRVKLAASQTELDSFTRQWQAINNRIAPLQKLVLNCRRWTGEDVSR